MSVGCRQWVVILGLVLFVSGASAATIKNMRVWRTSDYTRVVLDLDAPAPHTLTLAANPSRVIVDVKQVVFNKGSLNQLSLSETPIEAVRSSVVNKKDVRFVFDLKRGVSPKSFLLKKFGDSDDRLVIDLYDSADVNGKALYSSKKPVTANASLSKAPVSANDLREPVDFEHEDVSVGESAVVSGKVDSAGGKRSVLVVIDAGHGGEDTGALGPNNMREKDVTLAIAKELAAQFNAQPEFSARLTRSTDIFLPLQKRRDIARDMKADLFISIHADSFTDPSAYGASVFALSRKGATSEAARFLAQRENESDLIGRVGGVSLDDKDAVLAGVLVDLSMTATVNSSLQVGNNVLNAISSLSPLHSKRVEQAGFVVLKSPDVPSILVETGFISNKNESKKLASPSYRADMAKAILSGVKKYFVQHPPASINVAPAQTYTETTSNAAVKGADTIRRSDTRSGNKAASKNTIQPIRKHLVVRGDTLASIATEYKVSIISIKKENALKNDTVKLGQTLKIPAQ